MYEFTKDINEIINEEGEVYLDIECDNKEEYYKALKELQAFNNDKVKVTVKLANEDNIIFEQGELDLTGNKAEYKQKEE